MSYNSHKQNVVTLWVQCYVKDDYIDKKNYFLKMIEKLKRENKIDK